MRPDLDPAFRGIQPNFAPNKTGAGGGGGTQLTRRDFLKLSGVTLGYAAIPDWMKPKTGELDAIKALNSLDLIGGHEVNPLNQQIVDASGQIHNLVTLSLTSRNIEPLAMTGIATDSNQRFVRIDLTTSQEDARRLIEIIDLNHKFAKIENALIEGGKTAAEIAVGTVFTQDQVNRMLEQAKNSKLFWEGLAILGIPTAGVAGAVIAVLLTRREALSRSVSPDTNALLTATARFQSGANISSSATLSANRETSTPTITITPTPTSTETPAPTATLTPTEVPIPEKDVRLSAIKPFVNVMKMVGIEITEEQVNKGLGVQKRKDKDDKPFYVYVTSNTGNPSYDGVPLLLLEGQRNGEVKWREVERGRLGSLQNMITGAYTISWLLPEDSKYREVSLKDTNHFQLDDLGIWRYMEPKEGNLVELDKISAAADLAYANGKTFSLGSGLIWGDPDWGVPEWLSKKNLSSDEALKVAKSHIKTFLDYFKHKPGFTRVAVVNEILPSIFGTPYYWTDKIGINRRRLLKECFREAKNVAPDVELGLREYSVEFQGYPRSEEFFNLVTELNREELAETGRRLIEAVEFQLPLLHKSFIGYDPAMVPSYFIDKAKRAEMMGKLRSNFQRYKAAGINVYITELMLPINNLGSTLPKQLKTQAEIYEDIYQVCREEGVGVGLTRTNFSKDSRYAYPDPATNSLPYPRDDDFKPLPSHYAINRAILGTA